VVKERPKCRFGGWRNGYSIFKNLPNRASGVMIVVD
jgi:hypothetical protein